MSIRRDIDDLIDEIEGKLVYVTDMIKDEGYDRQAILEEIEYIIQNVL